MGLMGHIILEIKSRELQHEQNRQPIEPQNEETYMIQLRSSYDNPCISITSVP